MRVATEVGLYVTHESVEGTIVCDTWHDCMQHVPACMTRQVHLLVYSIIAVYARNVKCMDS